MKKMFRNIAFVLMIGISGITIDTEARLPKYMAQRAAELLIEKSGIIINFDERNLKELLKHLKYNKSPKLNKYASIVLRALGQDDSNASLINVLTQKLQDFKNDSNYSISRCKKEIQNAIYADKLVRFLYTTEKRQHLADWFRKAYKNRKYCDIKVSDANIELEDTFCLVKGVTKETTIDGNFINNCFPCWTGTLTCFILGEHKNIAKKALFKKEVVKKCKESLNGYDEVYKVVRILFSLELVDNWDDIKDICEKSDEPIPTLGIPYDPYDCVPVPNTAYLVTPTDSMPGFYQGSCMVSTIRNLVYMLCQNTLYPENVITDNIKEDIRSAFSDPIYEISGTTSFNKLKQFSDKILPGITEKYQPTLELFVCILNSLLREDLRESVVIPTPQQYLSGLIYQTVVKSILEKITGFHDITVIIQKDCPKLAGNWPECCLIINDKTINKKVTIAFGKRGAGEHSEIIDIR